MRIEHSDAGAGHLVERPSSFDELVKRLAELSAHYEPICGIAYAVDLVREAEGRLAVGMSADGWVLSYFPPDDGAPRNSIGDRTATGSVSFYFGDHTPMSRKYLVPRAMAIQALTEWWERGTPSSELSWTEENFLL